MIYTAENIFRCISYSGKTSMHKPKSVRKHCKGTSKIRKVVTNQFCDGMLTIPVVEAKVDRIEEDDHGLHVLVSLVFVLLR